MRVPFKRYSLDTYATVINWLAKYYNGHVRLLASWPGGGLLIVRYENKKIDSIEPPRVD